MTLPQETSIPCPLCGKELKVDSLDYGVPLHVCTPQDGSQPSPPRAPTFIPPYQAPPRIIPCTQCQQHIDVGAFDPLSPIECPHCRATLEVLKEFGDYNLIKAYEAGWHNAVYLAERKDGYGKAILKILSGHVVNQAGAMGEFLKECEVIRARCVPPVISSYSTGEVCGFHYMAAAFPHQRSDKEVLDAIGITLTLESVQLDTYGAARVTHCPECKAKVNVAEFDPLDEVVCSSCGQTFELFRQFSQFRLDYRLNAGGTSVLYLAQNLKNKRKLAIKVLSAAEIIRNPQSVQSFLREIGLTQKLIHPNIIRVYEGGEYQGFYYMCLELVEGMTLSEIMGSLQNDARSTKPSSAEWAYEGNKERFKQGLPELTCLEIMRQAAAGLGIAHENGLIHGDVKPENIMVTFEGYVKVLDFGLVQFANTEKLFVEGEEASVFGTPLYIPPERVRGEPEDFRSDIYSLGATLYHLLRGIAPFRAKTPEEVALMHVKSPLVTFKAYAPWVSDTTCRIVEKSLKKNVEDRYLSHIEFIADLTLAKQLMFQTMRKKPKDGQALLKSFMKSLPSRKKRFGIWQRATTTAIHVYKYVTMAITQRFRKQ